MCWRNQIKVELVEQSHNDLFPANVARVSFDKWHETFTTKADKPKGSDEGLLDYLAREEHSSPFRHVRETFIFEGWPFDLNDLNPFDIAGMCWEVNRRKQTVKIRHSLFGWLNLLTKEKIYMDSHPGLAAQLSELYPYCCNAFGLEVVPTYGHLKEVVHHTGPETNPWFIDVSLHCEAPITLARQAVKHQVMMSWNEVSRRYVDTPPELFKQEFRERPAGGIKQGSGATTTTVPLVHFCNTDWEATGMSVTEVTESLLQWYNDCVLHGIAPETVRGYLPLNMMTSWIWTGCLPALHHLVRLREDGHAQKEIQDFATKVNQQIESAHPGWYAKSDPKEL